MNCLEVTSIVDPELADPSLGAFQVIVPGPVFNRPLVFLNTVPLNSFSTVKGENLFQRTLNSFSAFREYGKSVFS